MAWRATSPMDQRIRFVKDARTGLYTLSELCERYDVSRKTGYKWTARFEAEGVAGLADRSRAPISPERRMSEAAREALLEVRRRHPSWGPRKILAWLEARHPRTTWPAASSVASRRRQAPRYADAMPVYVLAQITITDRARYERYQSRFMPVLQKYQGRLLAADEHPLVAEGRWDREKVVLFSFRDEAAFRRFAESPEYAEIAVDRKAGSDGVVLLVKGIG